MRLGKLLLRSLLLLLLVAGLAQWWVIRQAHDQAAKFAARMVPHGQFKYERLWAWPWGAVSLWHASFVSDGMLGLSMRIPQGKRFEARRVDLRRIRVDENRWPSELTIQVSDLRFAVTESRSRPARSPDPSKHPLPTFHDLGYQTIALDFEINWSYIRDVSAAVMMIKGQGPELGRIDLRAQLEGAPSTFRSAQDQIVVRRANLEFEDAGLLRRAKSFAIARARLSESEWREAMSRGLERFQQSGELKWDDESLTAIHTLLREPSGLQASIEPPGTLLLRNLRLYKMADWPALLGFQLTAIPPPTDAAPDQAAEKDRNWVAKLLSRVFGKDTD